MPSAEHPLKQLEKYIPAGAYDLVVPIIMEHRIHLTVSRERKTILGNYRHAHLGKNHRISVNGNLNPYEFLFTLLHEIAHLFTFEKYGHSVYAHGAEWKLEYSNILSVFTEKIQLPADIQNALKKSIQNPAASSCSEAELQRVFKQYDTKRDGVLFVENLPSGAYFTTGKGKLFQLGKKLRKRYQCTDFFTGQSYLISPICEVKQIELGG